MIYETHKLSHHPLYEVWASMKKRCYTKKNTAYKRYGKRGIRVCDEWKNSFKIFYNWSINSGWELGLEIDRRNNDGNYEPLNCRFVTRQRNMRNQGIKKTNTSGYIGVSYHNRNKKYQVQIHINNRWIFIGNYLNPKEAAIARDDFIIDNRLDHHLNFPNRRLKLMAKGGSFEGDISKELSLYLTHMRTEDGIWRTEGSGARATNKAKANMQVRLDQYGDITYTIPETKFWFDIFSVECKTGYAKKTKDKTKTKTTLTHWSLLDMIDSSQKLSQFHEFWEQCLNDAVESKREPILIFRRNRRSPCITMRNDVFAGFISRFGMPGVNTINLTTLFDPLPITIMNMRQFFDWTEQISESILKKHIVRQLLIRRIR